MVSLLDSKADLHESSTVHAKRAKRGYRSVRDNERTGEEFDVALIIGIRATS